MSWPRAAANTAAAALAATAIWLLHQRTFLDYDTIYALVWGDDIVHGRLPEYEVPLAPTPHPLANAVGALAALLGEAAVPALLAVGIFSVGWLGVGVFRLGEALFAWPVGLLAALIVLTRVPILSYGVRAYVDLPAAALVVWAAVLEARRPRRGAPVLVLLGLAGLLRPEAWLFAAIYWLWLVPGLDRGARVRLAALAGASPAVWMLSDLIVTGNPLWSLTGTSDKTTALNFTTGLGALPGVVPRRLGEILRLPELIAAVLGFGAGLALFPRRLVIPIALGAVTVAMFVAFAAFGLPLLGRYLFLAATMLAIFAALAAFGWTALPADHPARRPWSVAGLAVVGLLVAFVPQQADRLKQSRAQIAERQRAWDDLHELLGDPRAEAALERCGEVFVPNHRAIPFVAHWAGRRASRVLSAQIEQPSPRGVFVTPATLEAKRLTIFSPIDPRPLDAPVPDGYREVAVEGAWELHAGCPRGVLAQALALRRVAGEGADVRRGVTKKADRAPVFEAGPRAFPPSPDSGQASPRRMGEIA